LEENEMTKKRWLYTLVIVLFLIQGNLFAQQRCMFVSAEPDPGKESDIPLIDKVLSWGYDVTVVASNTLASMTAADYAQYDFAFLSESPNSSDYAPLSGHPLPLLILEAWACGKPTVLHWTSTQSVANVGPLYILITDDTGHQLDAGFSTGTDLQLSTATLEGYTDECEIEFVPTIEVITIATFLDDPTQTSICGVEEGTLLADGTTLTENRAEVIGIHEHGYPYITDEAFQLMQAGIHWILHEEVSVEKQQNQMPQQFSLNQNFPNPFNPSTEITFSLEQPEHAMLTVFNALGRKVETLVDQRLSAGVYKLSFDAQNLPAGVYFYQLQAGRFSEMKKMVLMK
jgi:hypothetical protein